MSVGGVFTVMHKKRRPLSPYTHQARCIQLGASVRALDAIRRPVPRVKLLLIRFDFVNSTYTLISEVTKGVFACVKYVPPRMGPLLKGFLRLICYVMRVDDVIFSPRVPKMEIRLLFL
jgi:hypothetical protein